MTRHNRHNGLLPAPTCCEETGVMDFGLTFASLDTSIILLRTMYHAVQWFMYQGRNTRYHGLLKIVTGSSI